MRKGIAGLSALAQDVLRQRPASGAVFAFRGRRGDRLKLLGWDGQGFWIWYKRLEQGVFEKPQPTPQEPGTRHLEIDVTQLALIIHGVELSSAKRHTRYSQAG